MASRRNIPYSRLAVDEDDDYYGNAGRRADPRFDYSPKSLDRIPWKSIALALFLLFLGCLLLLLSYFILSGHMAGESSQGYGLLALGILTFLPADVMFLFQQMRSYNVGVDCFTCSFVLKACVDLRDVSCARIVHALIEKLGYQSNLVLVNALIHLYAICGVMGDAVLLFDKMPQRDVVSWNVMITQLAKEGDVDEAFELFGRMKERNLRSWTAMITGLVHCGKAKEAVRLFVEMEETGLKANEVTVVAVLAACADLGALELGRRIHEYSDESGFKRNVHVCNTLIDMYIKCGCLEAAKVVFEDLKDRTIVSWSAMIQGLAIHGQADEALELFNEMIRMGVKPNEVTFLGILHACSHMGMIKEGREFFASMSRDYNISPQIEHYGCMVDLLSRAGLLQDAYELITSMPIKPNAVIWGSFLGGCRIQKDVEMAEEAMRHLGVLDPLNDGYYIIMSNIYAEAKRWEDAARVRKLMKDRGVKKTPGLSTITIAQATHEFVAGDDNHPQADEIFKRWDKLLEQMKSKGYVPNTSLVVLDIEENEKERYLYRHSEKLALVFGLMNTKAGETIRIMKNLRVCEDCHAAFKDLLFSYNIAVNRSNEMTKVLKRSAASVGLRLPDAYRP
ncbi:hypothetical protein CQW23_17991 [Capsicum baccatum]|uniref:DYW domain-containing protein n=1 Tax=Capsicum baccatum TaxID=33114 RepID=A0A2G2WFD7_CAPBA|nr:hypothetical protein CQW23_17991 [Capsicum baccatum]